MIQQFLHKQTLEKMNDICAWFDKKSGELAYPIYSSYDIRDSGYKISNVDANIYPAGFNNICPVDKESAAGKFKNYFTKHYQDLNIVNVLLLTEEHTGNPFYWDNVYAIKQLLEESGKIVKVGIPKEMELPLLMTSASGKEVMLYSALKNSSLFKDFVPDLIVSNNDFSNPYEDWAADITWKINPPRELGWYQRKKSTYFKHYNNLVNEFSEVAGIDPFSLRVETELFEGFDIGSEESRQQLAHRVDSMIAKLKENYLQRGITQEPFVFVKNNAGTYGLAVIRVGSGQEVLEWTYKARKKMKAAKGGRDVEEVIIQEGIPSIVQADGASAEPVIYMVGCELAGGFLRTHAEKSSTDSLNSPGAVYKKLCVSDLAINTSSCPEENVYGWTAKLGLLAIALEAKEMKVQFESFKKASCVAN